MYCKIKKGIDWMFIFNIPTMISIPKLVIDMMITTTYIPIVV